MRTELELQNAIRKAAENPADKLERFQKWARDCLAVFGTSQQKEWTNSGVIINALIMVDGLVSQFENEAAEVATAAPSPPVDDSAPTPFRNIAFSREELELCHQALGYLVETDNYGTERDRTTAARIRTRLASFAKEMQREAAPSPPVDDTAQAAPPGAKFWHSQSLVFTQAEIAAMVNVLQCFIDNRSIASGIEVYRDAHALLKRFAPNDPRTAGVTWGVP